MIVIGDSAWWETQPRLARLTFFFGLPRHFEERPVNWRGTWALLIPNSSDSKQSGGRCESHAMAE
jgi:hypothetical protein